MFENFLKKENLNIDKKVILKLDLDSDGLISYDDLYAILYRYKDTLLSTSSGALSSVAASSCASS